MFQNLQIFRSVMAFPEIWSQEINLLLSRKIFNHHKKGIFIIELYLATLLLAKTKCQLSKLQGFGRNFIQIKC